MARELVAERRRRPPTHPGAVLREDVLPALGLTVSEAARQLRVTRQTLHRILSETSGVSPEMAMRLGRFCGNGAGVWLRLQQALRESVCLASATAFGYWLSAAQRSMRSMSSDTGSASMSGGEKPSSVRSL